MTARLRPATKSIPKSLAILVLLLICSLCVVSGVAAAPQSANTNAPTTAIKSTSLGVFTPTFVGPAAAGCASGCSLLTGPFYSPSTDPSSSSDPDVATSQAAAPLTAAPLAVTPLAQSAVLARGPRALPSPVPPRPGAPDPTPPTVSCQPLGPGCDFISKNPEGAYGVKGLNAVDSATQATNVTVGDIEPPDQGLCAGNGYVVETNNIGEVLIFNTSLQRKSSVIPLDTIMGLTGRGWSSGGDISCAYDYSNGGHWFFTEFVSASTEASGGPFSGCFAPVASTCYEGIAVTVGSDPFGPYNVYFLDSNYNPAEPGYPFLLNDFTKIGVTRDAFLVFYDEFPQSPTAPGLGGGGFNGAQEFAFDKNALELGWPTTFRDGKPNPFFNVAIENMGLLPTPDGTCFSDNTFHAPGFTCWYQDIPAMPPDPTQFDNSHGGSGFILGSLDFYGQGDTRIAAFAWTGLENLNTPFCFSCGGIKFGGQLLSGVNYYYGEGFQAAQKKGPIPLGDECGAANLSVVVAPATTAPASCPEGGIATNGDGFTQVSQAQSQLWGAVSTAVGQSYWWTPTPEVHQGAAYWVIGTDTFDTFGFFTLTGQGYVSPAHEDLEFPAMAAGGFPEQDGGDGKAIVAFTLSGNGGPTGADHGGFYPSTAYGRLTSSSNGLLESEVNIVDLGEAPQDGFTEYQGYPGPTRPRWGDYNYAIFLPWSGGTTYFSTNYIQSPNCKGHAFTLTLATCGGTRDGMANWGTSVNSVVP
jgi:hypothetical protein